MWSLSTARRVVRVALAMALANVLFPAALLAQNAEPRCALVIGNGNYSAFGKLANPPNDAADIAETLKSLGFAVTLLRDADLQAMEQAVIQFGNALSASSGSIGFFYYAGHGVQSNGINYLIPVNADIPGEAFLRTKALAVQSLLDTLQLAANKLNVVVLDACRNNPFSWSRAGTRGLTVVSQQPPGSILAYATSAGSVAADGTGRNGIFTGALLKNLSTLELSIFDVFLRTGADVKAATNGAQVPAIYSQYFEKLSLSAASQPRMAQGAAISGRQLEQYLSLIAKADEAANANAWGEALAAFTSALARVPDSEAAAFGVAQAYGNLGNRTKADSLFRDIDARGAVPNAWDYGTIAGFYLYQMEDADTAIAMYTKAIAAMDVFSAGWPLRGRGLANRAKGDLTQARADTERALSLAIAQSDADLAADCRSDLAALEGQGM
jgi:Tfp pilus assembly protein PilF